MPYLNDTGVAVSPLRNTQDHLDCRAVVAAAHNSDARGTSGGCRHTVWRSGIYGGTWVCTLDEGHEGPHVASSGMHGRFVRWPWVAP